MATPQEAAASLQAAADAYHGKINDIDARVSAAEAEVDGFIGQQKSTGYTTATDVDDEGSWDRVFSIYSHRTPIQVTVGITGGWFNPGFVTFQMFVNPMGDLFVQTVSKLGSQYATKVRTTTDNLSTGPSYVEIYIPHRHQQRNRVTVEAISHELPTVNFVNAGVNLPSLSKLSSEITL